MSGGVIFLVFSVNEDFESTLWLLKVKRREKEEIGLKRRKGGGEIEEWWGKGEF